MLVYVAAYVNYDDFDIEGVFSDKDKAIQCAKDSPYPVRRRVFVYDTETGQRVETILIEDVVIDR